MQNQKAQIAKEQRDKKADEALDALARKQEQEERVKDRAKVKDLTQNIRLGLNKTLLMTML